MLVPFSILVVVCRNVLPGMSQNIGGFVPDMVPLGIRSPYFNAWVQSRDPAGDWPRFWNDQILGWSGFVRIDGTVWKWLGGSFVPTSNTSLVTHLEITPTRTTYQLNAGPMDLTITYLTPIEPADPVKQSFPFTYISLEASSTDGKSHSVQVYSDISAEWCSGNRSETVMWGTTTTDSTVYHSVRLQQPTLLTENNVQVEDATVYYAMTQRPGVTVRIGVDSDCRSQFASVGSLSGSASPSSGVIDSPFYVFALSMDLGQITATSAPVVWSLGVVRDVAVNYTTGSGKSESRVPYFKSQYHDIQSAIAAFVKDYSSASSRASNLDNTILNNANSVSSQYANLVSLAARQTIGSTEITVANSTGGNWNISDVKMFMKDIGGNNRRTNPVEVLYASFPFFLYLNASWGGQLLAPFLEFQDSTQWTQSYAARDLGNTYPQATGKNLAHGQGVEQSSIMLIMTLAHARASGDGHLLSLHYNLLKAWGNYLVNNTLTPTQQVTADFENQANITNLAIKGIIGIRAMAEISLALGKEEDAQHFGMLSEDISSSYASTWQSLSLSSDHQHILLSYEGDSSSWSMLYNLYADKLLSTGIISDDIYQLTTNFYKNLLASSAATQYGLPLDSNVTSLTQTNAAWTLFTAATVSNSSVLDAFISRSWTSANNTAYFPEVYRLDSTIGVISGKSSPAMGAMFSLLALNVENKTITFPSLPSAKATGSKKSVVGSIVGGVIGGLTLIGIVVVGVFLWKRRGKHFPAPAATDMREDRFEEQTMIPYDYNPHEQSREPETVSLQQAQLQSQPALVRPIPLVQGVMIPSNKAREAASNARSQTPSIRVSSGPSGSNPIPNRESPRATSSSNTTRISTTAVQGLRADVENLRRAMEEIQAERMEAPPGYHDI